MSCPDTADKFLAEVGVGLQIVSVPEGVVVEADTSINSATIELGAEIHAHENGINHCFLLSSRYTTTVDPTRMVSGTVAKEFRRVLNSSLRFLSVIVVIAKS